MLIYYGPTMGKTYACKSNPNLIDFDDLIRDIMIKTAKSLNMEVRDFKKSNNPLYLRLIELKLYHARDYYSDKIVMVSNAGALEFPWFFHKMYIPSRDKFIERNMQRGGTKEDSESWYDDIMNKHCGRELLTIEDRFISELHPL